RAPCPRPSCTSCAPASTAGSAIRPPAASCAAGCRSGWCGVRPTDRSTGIPTRRSPASSPRSSNGSPCAGRCAGCGCGCASGTCGRKLAVYYDGPAKATPGYYCTGTGQLVDGRGTRHLRVGGVAIDTAVAAAFLAALQPSALQACLAAAQHLEDGHDTALAQW